MPGKGAATREVYSNIVEVAQIPSETEAFPEKQWGGLIEVRH